MKTIIAILLTLICCSCVQAKKDNTSLNKETNRVFEFNRKSINIGEGVTNSIIFNNVILCKLTNGKILALDTNFNKIDTLTRKFDSYKVSVFRFVNDTLFCFLTTNFYYLDSNFTFNRTNNEIGTYGGDYIYDDDSYSVYNGGDITLFANKKTGRTFGYPIPNATQILKHGDSYLIGTNNKFYSDLFKLSNPDSLFEYRRDGNGSNAESWITRDKSNEWHPKPNQAITEALHPDTSFNFYNFLLTFPFGADYYTIFTTDSLTLLAKHTSKQLRVIDTVFKDPTFTNYPKVHYFNNMILACNSYGLFVIKGNQITLVKFE